MIKLNINIGDIYGCWLVLKPPEKTNDSKLNYCWCRCVQCNQVEQYVRCTDLIHKRTRCKCQRKHKYNIIKPQPIRTKSFKDWCIESGCCDFLDRWDYELNKYTPDVVSYKSEYNIYFKCPQGKHKSRAIQLRWISERDTDCDCLECKLESDSFGKWCEDNNPAILDLWDYEKNIISPYEILYGTNKKYYFKCPYELHESHRQIICNISTNGAPICCDGCNSIGQWIIDHYSEDYLNSIWDYDKNIESPFKISFGSKTKVFLKCLNDHEHPSYPIPPQRITRGDGCPECKNERISSKLQQKVNEYIFEQYGYDVLHEYACTLKPINPKTKYALPYDNQVIIGFNVNLIIEVMGMQHYKTTGYIKQAANRHNITPEEELLDLQWRDLYKKQYALDNDFFYLAIPYWTEKDCSYKQLIDDQIHEILSLTQQNDYSRVV